MPWRSVAAFLSLTLAGSSAPAQEPVSQHPILQNPVSQAEVSLEPKDGRTQYPLGDAITLELVFRDPAFPDLRASVPKDRAYLPVPGQSVVNATDYNDIADDVTITPSTGWFQWQGRSGHDYAMDAPVDATGVRVPIVLNEGYVFREPGHYQVTVTTSRMGGHPLTTNAVDIDIAPRSAEDEAALVKTLVAAIASTTSEKQAEQQCDGQESAAQQLAYLTGDDAARAKVKLLVESKNQEIKWAVTKGLVSARNQELQLELLKAAWDDPRIDGVGTLPLKQAEAFARGQMERGWSMGSTAKPVTPEQQATALALAAEYSDDLNRAIASLPRRTGKVRRDTAFALIENNELSPEQLARVKPVVLEEFPHMDPMAQSMLIETRWNAVKDPSLAPYLKAMIDSRAQNMDAATAVERLIEIDERDAKPYVIDMVCRPGRGLLLDKLNGVKADRLPEVDACLAEMLAKGERNENDFEWEQAAQRAARFATPAILPQVKAVWTNASQNPLMLAILMRDAPKEAVALLNREPEISWIPANTVYGSLGEKFPEDVLTWMRNPSAPTIAMDELGLFGEAQDRALLERRLETLRGKWIGRAAEMKDALPGTPAYAAKSDEQELVVSLLTAKAWTLTANERRKITDGCLSDWCHAHDQASETGTATQAQ